MLFNNIKKINISLFSISILYICINTFSWSYLHANITGISNYNNLNNKEQKKLEINMTNNDNDEYEEYEEEIPEDKIIKKVILTGNTLLTDAALYAKIPYREGQIFNPTLTSQLIKNLHNLNYFDDIQVGLEELEENKINIHVFVKEKYKIESINFEGNNNLKPDEIEKKLNISQIPAINQEEANLIAQLIKKMYQEKNYHEAKVIPELILTQNNNVKLLFKIEEGKRALVKRVNFVGNKTYAGKILRGMIFTREDWILGAMDKAGTYQPEAIDYDKHVIENFYQSNGFLAAKVKDVNIDINPETQNINVTFIIDEGDLYTIKNISAPGNNILTEEQILAAIPIKPDMLYNKELIRRTLEMLRNTWGRFGYIYADVDPRIIPDFENKTVDITFNSDLGNQVFLNRINIIGNYKTRDYVIRRNIALNEGEIITTQLMDISKGRVEGLGFFDPKEGVNWKINKVDENLADLDLYVTEIKTGKLFGQIGYGGADLRSPSTTLRLLAGIADRNLLGTGIRYNFNLTWSKEDRSVLFSLFQPWILGQPIGGGLDFYLRKAIYEDFRNVKDIPVENVRGLVGQISFAPKQCPDLGTVTNLGFERITYDNPVIVSNVGSPEETGTFQMLVNRRFQPGDLFWVGFITGQDLRNHPVFPSCGYNWNFTSKFAFPTRFGNFGFAKIDLDATWLTPIIGDSALIFFLHGHIGFAKPFKNRVVPYRELYHIGGPATVRGFLFGQIGPQLFGDSIGAEKAFWINAELIFSVTKDRSIRAVVFYDGGAGWETPNATAFANLPLINNKFRYRHAVGFGIRLTQPTPLKVDWGFKLDRNRRLGESISEVHFSMAQDF